MPKINVYLPDELAVAVREAGIPVSSVCQRALADAVAAVDGRGRFTLPAGDDQEFELPNLSRTTQRAQKILAIAQDSAASEGRSPSSPDIVAALIEEGHNLALTVLSALDVDAADLYQECRANEASRLRTGTTEPDSGSALLEILGRSADEAVALEHNYIGSEHLLLGIAAGPAEDPTVAALHTLGADLEAIRGATRAALAGMTYAQANVYTTALSAPVRSILDEIRQRLGRLEDTKRSG